MSVTFISSHMLLLITYSRDARQTLRNVCRLHEDVVRRRVGKAVLFEPTHLAAFFAMRVREKHPGQVQIHRTRPLKPEDVPTVVARAARRYERRSDPHTPYSAFATGRDLPTLSSMADREL